MPPTGLIDIQCNGYAGVDFLGDLVTAEQLRRVAERLQVGGVRAILPTITTDKVERMAARLDNFRRLVDADATLSRLMPAFHIEGPCISPVEGYRGAHDPACIIPATPQTVEPLVRACGGWDRLAVFTLAPEVDEGLRTTRWLAQHGVIVAAGHTDAPLDLLRASVDAGLSIYTHMGNGCAQQIPRHDNIINRALSVDGLRFSLIPDGHHVPWFVLKLWLKLAGLERCIFVTDCITAADAPPGRYSVGRIQVEVGENRRVQMPGTPNLAGSALTMSQAYANAISHLGLTAAQAQQLCADQPAAWVAKFLR